MLDVLIKPIFIMEEGLFTIKIAFFRSQIFRIDNWSNFITFLLILRNLGAFCF